MRAMIVPPAAVERGRMWILTPRDVVPGIEFGGETVYVRVARVLGCAESFEGGVGAGWATVIHSGSSVSVSRGGIRSSIWVSGVWSGGECGMRGSADLVERAGC